ncbi:hypothetical protein HBB16_13860 [Pseudonocardia sp. MCCB 268]|nr:hypothetical protein [Pseudonocardia cytotoxica]
MVGRGDAREAARAVYPVYKVGGEPKTSRFVLLRIARRAGWRPAAGEGRHAILPVTSATLRLSGRVVELARYNAPPACSSALPERASTTCPHLKVLTRRSFEL